MPPSDSLGSDLGSLGTSEITLLNPFRIVPLSTPTYMVPHCRHLFEAIVRTGGLIMERTPSSLARQGASGLVLDTFVLSLQLGHLSSISLSGSNSSEGDLPPLSGCGLYCTGLRPDYFFH